VAVSDYFAEVYVAGRFADADWNVYFPHRDKGFDFIVSKPDGHGGQILRPVQVKGKYPTREKRDQPTYGYVGRLTQLHPEMVLAVPYFSAVASPAPTCIAYLPISLIRKHARGYRCEPALFHAGLPRPRRDFAGFFDDAGLLALEAAWWKDSTTHGVPRAT